MDPRSLHFIADACRVSRPAGGENPSVSRICTDSRQARPGDLFVAIAGDRFDGHQFVSEAAVKGVAAVLVQAGRWNATPLPCPVLEVPETRKALGQIAAAYRRDFSIQSLAVAGSNGKTTTKELVASVLRQERKVIWSDASFNNEIGVPFTLFKLESIHAAAVFELGTNHPGELAPLIEMVQPKYGIITSIGREHLEYFKDLDGVAQEEGSLAALLPSDGVLFLQGGTEWTDRLAARARCGVVKVGTSSDCDWRVGELSVSGAGTRFRVAAAPSGFVGDYHLRLLGRHQVVNALLAAAAGQAMGISAEGVKRGLAECAPPKSRLVLTEQGGVGVLDDSYNANADSMIAAVRTLKDLPCKGRRVAVLGDMAELGEDTLTAHQEVGRAVAEAGVDLLVTVGAHAQETARTASAAGLRRIEVLRDPEETINFLKASVEPGDVVLIKASRAAGLDRVSEALKKS